MECGLAGTHVDDGEPEWLGPEEDGLVPELGVLPELGVVPGVVPELGELPELGVVGGVAWAGGVVRPVLGPEGGETTVFSLAGGLMLTGVTLMPPPAVDPSVDGAEPPRTGDELAGAGPPGAVPGAAVGVVELDADAAVNGS